jgi:hypothetical protein
VKKQNQEENEMTSSLEKVQAGDKVFEAVEIRQGFGAPSRFFLPRKVAKVTKTQLTLEDGRRFTKKTGASIGKDSVVYAEGESYWGYLIRDQTKEFEEAKAKIRLATKCRILLAEMPPISADAPNLERVYELLLEMKDILVSK